MIVALAGRRIDAADAKAPRFPQQNVQQVHDRVREFLKEEGATLLVSSAACGSDLIALEEAGKLGLRRRVVLPFGRERFKETSVTDRAGDWGSVFDAVLNQVEASGDLVVHEYADGDAAYKAANRDILDDAQAVGRATGQTVEAVLIWNGSRGQDDITEDFGLEAAARGMTVKSIPIL